MVLEVTLSESTYSTDWKTHVRHDEVVRKKRTSFVDKNQNADDVVRFYLYTFAWTQYSLHVLNFVTPTVLPSSPTKAWSVRITIKMHSHLHKVGEVHRELWISQLSLASS